MSFRVIILVFVLLSGNNLFAQRILYSPFIGNPSSIRFEVIGKAGGYYWVQKSKKKNRTQKKAEPWINDRELSFEIYDERMNLVKTIASSVSDSVLKEYFVPGEKFMDQLVLKHFNDSTGVLLNRFTDDGEKDSVISLLCAFPANMNGADFLLVRSQDKNKILLLGFEAVPDSAPHIHSYLFDNNWKQLNYALITDRRITQPFIQYDAVDYPLEHFTNCPVKLANSGEWLMLSSARINNGNLLFHFSAGNRQYEIKEMRLSKNASVQDVVLSLNNEKREVQAGVLSQFRSPLAKSVRLIQYSLGTCCVLYDTLYRFNTIAAVKNTGKNIFEEYFMAVPGKGFLLLKEYGRTYGSTYSSEELITEDEPLSYTSPGSKLPVNKNDYTRYNHLAGTKALYDRGDLSMYYFSATGKDSCWSGIINKEQATELNSATLSYVFLPADDKLFFLYNSFYRNRDNYSSSTILDPAGNALNEGLIYWNINNTLLFQKARQITANELAIPYEKNARNGFAIVKL